MSEDARIGSIIDGKYELQRVIGRGGMGAVYVARQLRLDRLVAIKLLRPDVTADERAVARFNREARAAARIEHPNAVRVYDFGSTDDGGAFIAMEYVEGVPLRVMMRRSRVLPLEVVMDIIWQASAAVAAAHEQGIVHRDLKPENLMVRLGDDGAMSVKVVDFGLAKLLEGDSMQITSPAEMIGTPKYMAPEQFSGDDLDERVDVYALGVITYEMLAGRPPFDGTFSEVVGKHLYAEPPTFESLGIEAVAGLETVVRRALAKRPAERTATANDLARGLARCFGVDVPAGTSLISTSAATSRGGLADIEALLAPEAAPELSPEEYATRYASRDDAMTELRRAPAGFAVPPAVASAPTELIRPASSPRRSWVLPAVLALVGLVAVASLGVGLLVWRATRPTAPLAAKPEVAPGAPAEEAPSKQYKGVETPHDDEESDDGDDASAPQGVPFYMDGKIVIYDAGARFAPGSTLEIRNPRNGQRERFGLERNEKGTKWVVKRASLSVPGGLTVESLVPPRTPVEMVIRNPNGSATTPTLINREDE
jgi:serine/threonine protein kinase